MKFEKIPFKRKPTRRPEPYGDYVWSFKELETLIKNSRHPYNIPTRLSNIKTSTLKEMLTTVSNWSEGTYRNHLSRESWSRILPKLITYRETIGRHD